MRPLSTRQLLLCLALAAAFGHAGAAEARHASNESAPQPEPASAQNDRFDDADIDGAVATMHSSQRAAQKPKSTASATPAHTAGDSRTLPARFHSFLPGMFR